MLYYRLAALEFLDKKIAYNPVKWRVRFSIRLTSGTLNSSASILCLSLSLSFWCLLFWSVLPARSIASFTHAIQRKQLPQCAGLGSCDCDPVHGRGDGLGTWVGVAVTTSGSRPGRRMDLWCVVYVTEEVMYDVFFLWLQIRYVICSLCGCWIDNVGPLRCESVICSISSSLCRAGAGTTRWKYGTPCE